VITVTDIKDPGGSKEATAMRVFVTGASGWIGSATVDRDLDQLPEAV